MNTGLVAAFKERCRSSFLLTPRGDVKSVFVGHDHANDCVIDFEGLLLGYGRKTGYGCYGPPEGYLRGF